MNLAKVTGLIGLALLISGCNNSFRGRLNVFEPLELSSGKKTVDVPAGQYDSKIEFTDKTSLKVSLKSGDQSRSFKFNVPEFTQNQEVFEIPAEMTGQNYGLQGDRTVKETLSHVITDFEPCTYTVPQRVCTVDSHGRPYCFTRMITVWGQRYVEFRIRTVIQFFIVQLKDRYNKIAAEFDGSKSDQQRLYNFVGHCR